MKEEEAKILAKKFNSLREEWGENSFSHTDIKILLKEEKLPSQADFLKSYVANGILVKKERNQYSFSGQPIYYKIVEKAISEIRNLRNKYQRNYVKKHSNIETSSSSVATPFFTEKDAIEMLKHLGYKIYKPVTNYEEI